MGLLPTPRLPLFLCLGEQTFSCSAPAEGPEVCSPLLACPYSAVQGSKLFSCPVPAEGPWVCSPLPSIPYSSVQGSKLFNARLAAAPLLGRPLGPGFAPHSLLALIPPSKGANFFLPGAGRWVQGLLPTPRLPLFLHPREQTFSCPVPAEGSWVCSSLPASPYFFVLGSKLFPARLAAAPLLGRISAFLGPEVRAPKPILLALRVPGREPSRRPGRISALLGPAVRA